MTWIDDGKPLLKFYIPLSTILNRWYTTLLRSVSFRSFATSMVIAVERISSCTDVIYPLLQRIPESSLLFFQIYVPSSSTTTHDLATRNLKSLRRAWHCSMSLNSILQSTRWKLHSVVTTWVNGLNTISVLRCFSSLELTFVGHCLSTTRYLLHLQFLRVS